MGENPSTATDETTPPESSISPPAGTAHYRAFLLRLHFYAGIFVGPFLLIAAISGGLYAIAPTIEQKACHWRACGRANDRRRGREDRAPRDVPGP